VPWNPEQPEDDRDEKGEVWDTLMSINVMLDSSGVGVNTATCNLHSNPIFRRGGLTNPDPKIRDLARLKVERTLRIGNLLGAEYFTYWVARDGWEVATTVPWGDIYKWIALGLTDAYWYIKNHYLDSYIGGTIEPKPNEPRGHMFLPTAGHAVGFIEKRLNHPDFWKVNPELTQHEGMTLLDPLTTVAYLVSMDKLAFLHLGNQIKGQFDDDFPPLVGPEHLKETAYMFWLLEKLGWKGVVEFDCHMLRCEADPNDSIGCRRRFIENCSVGLAVALQLAERLKVIDEQLFVGMLNRDGYEKITESQTDLITTAAMCKLSYNDTVAFATRK
jgi:xylose isomerase